jgi:hypothetical protein
MPNSWRTSRIAQVAPLSRALSARCWTRSSEMPRAIPHRELQNTPASLRAGCSSFGDQRTSLCLRPPTIEAVLAVALHGTTVRLTRPVPSRCQIAQPPRELAQAPSAARQRRAPQQLRLPFRAQASPPPLTRHFSPPVALRALHMRSVSQLSLLAASFCHRCILAGTSSQRPMKQMRPNPSFNLTFSGWLRQPPNAS